MQPPAWQTGQMDRKKWFDSSQPQTLQIAVILLYINAVFALIFALSGSLLLIPLLLGGLAAFGIANEKRVAYIGAIVLSVIFAGLALLVFVQYAGFSSLVNVAFAIALFVALIHPMSRSYERIWFK
jgi:predicted signal transduction protein with EAL and GGDEF domain